MEQFGIHLEQSTVRESLLFSAAMRLGYTVSNAKREALCDSVLKALELKSIENKLVGNATTGLSFEEIKRLTIAVELVANPAILFADEPTSGLEAHAALTVMRVLRRLADSGRTVVATVHQPNEEIFNMFDRLLLLKRGGEVVYFDKIGTNSKQLLSYFQAIPGVEPCGKAINPATWMLNVIGAGTQTTETNAKDFAGIYRSSSIYTDTLRTISQLASKEAADNTIHCENNDPKQQREGKVVDAIGASTSHATVKSDAACEETVFAVGFPAQVALLSRRNFLEYYRTPGYSLYRVLIVTGLSIVAGLIFVGGKLRDASDVQSIISSISVIVTVAGNYNVGTIIPFMYEHKALFYRERASNTYSAEAFAVAANLVEDPFILVSSSNVLNALRSYVQMVCWSAASALHGHWLLLHCWVGSLAGLGVLLFPGDVLDIPHALHFRRTPHLHVAAKRWFSTDRCHNLYATVNAIQWHQYPRQPNPRVSDLAVLSFTHALGDGGLHYDAVSVRRRPDLQSVWHSCTSRHECNVRRGEQQ